MVSQVARAFAGLCVAAVASTAVAQEQSTNRVAAKTDWSVFVEDNPTECWSVSTPKETVNSRGGKPVSVKRGDILLYVFNRPGAGVAGQVTFTGGYPFASDSTVKMTIGNQSFELFTDGEWAWPESPSVDAKIIAAMKRGSKAVMTARSGRGTVTKDTFSLLGVTAAIDDAKKRCGN